MDSPIRVVASRSKDGLRSLVADLMEVHTNEIDDTGSLIDLGLDSVNMMRLPLLLKRHGYDIALTDLMTQPTIDAWWSLVQGQADRPVQPAAPVPSLTVGDRFALTPIQQAYLVGRRADQDLGGNACHLYCEFDGENVDPGRLETAIRHLCRHHPMLRATFFEDGHQQIMAEARWTRLPVRDFRDLSPEDLENSLGIVRDSLSHRKLDVLNGEVFDIRLSLLPDGRTRIHLNIDLLIADVHSIAVFLRDMATAYDGDPLPVNESGTDFRSYLAGQAANTAHRYEDAARYWRARLQDLPSGPALPLAHNIDRSGPLQFTRREFRLTLDDVESLRKQASRRGLTLATTLASAYALVLSRWSETKRFLLNLPLFDRQEVSNDIPDMIADFTSLVLVDVDTSKAVDFGAFASSVQAQLHQDVAHGAFSGIEVLREMRRIDPSHSAPVVLACNFAQPLLTPRFEQSLGRFGWSISQTPQVWLDHQIYRLNDGFLLNWDAVDAIFPEGVLDAMFATYRRVVRDLCDGRWQEAGELPLPAGQAETRVRVNDTAARLDDRLLHEPFLAHAERAPDAPALLWSGGAWTYGRLRDRAWTLAVTLESNGLKPGDHVAVQLPKGPDQIAAVLGILMAGGVYVPVAADSPPARLARILSDAGCRYAFASAHAGSADAAPEGLRWLDPAVIEDVSPEPDRSLPNPDRKPGDLAYIIYTSGSTGAPKGVMIDHRGALNTVLDVNRRWSVTSTDRVFGLSALTFDLSVYDIFGALAAGAALVLPDEDGRRDPDHWRALADRFNVSVWNSVPALMAMLVEHTERRDLQLPSSLRLALLSGDWIPVSLPKRLRARSNGLRLVGLGGATEASIWSNWFEIEAVDPEWLSIPYGYPLTNQRYHILDDDLRPCPDWVAGELHIAGDGLAKGYWNDDEKTSRSFVYSPAGERLYRTGDRGRYWPDGTLEFLGRRDHQVKIGGNRIELGEIDAALARIPGVAHALSEVRDLGGQRQIVAYIVPDHDNDMPTGTKAPDAPIDDAALKAQLSRSLPDYMLPRAYMVLPALPLSSNGKIDRAKLPDFPEATAPDNAGQAPVSTLHRTVARAWAESLGIADVPPHGNFFDLGGDSLVAIRVTSDLSRLCRTDISVRQLFEHPVLADFVASLAARTAGKEVRP